MNIYTPNSYDPFILELKEWCKNNPLNIEELGHEKVDAWNKGVPLSDEWKKNISKSTKGIRVQGENQRAAASITAQKRNSTIIKCEHCGKESNQGNYKRWHGERCGKTWQHSTETKNKISESLVGRSFSNEHKTKLSEANRRRKGIKFKKKN